MAVVCELADVFLGRVATGTEEGCTVTYPT
jgi:hypothetical protein